MGLPLLITFLLPGLPQAVAVLQFGLFRFSLRQTWCSCIHFLSTFPTRLGFGNPARPPRSISVSSVTTFQGCFLQWPILACRWTFLKPAGDRLLQSLQEFFSGEKVWICFDFIWILCLFYHILNFFFLDGEAWGCGVFLGGGFNLPCIAQCSKPFE